MGSTVVRLRSVGDIRKYIEPFTDDCKVTNVDVCYYFDSENVGGIKISRAAEISEGANLQPTNIDYAAALSAAMDEYIENEALELLEFDWDQLAAHLNAALQKRHCA